MEVRIERNDDPELVLSLGPGGGFQPAPGELARRHGVDPEGHVRAVTPDGRVVGVGGGTFFPADGGGVGWVHGMVVAPDARGQGVGRAILRHVVARLETLGATTIALHATDAGRPLYASEGFRPDGEAPRWRRPEGSVPRPPEGERRVAVYPISACEVMDLWAYDKPRFGANRVPWLASAMARFPERTFVAFDRASGAIVGLVESQERWIGPLVADDAHAAAWLLYAAERAGAPPLAIAAPGSAGAEALLRAAGYEPEGLAPLRMVRGAPLPGRPDAQLLLSGWALG